MAIFNGCQISHFKAKSSNFQMYIKFPYFNKPFMKKVGSNKFNVNLILISLSIVKAYKLNFEEK